MIRSMTGYGKGAAEKNELTVTVEIKTVNHRYTDVSVKLPRTFMGLENLVRKQVGQALGRGKVDVYVNYELTAGAETTPVLNQKLAAVYHRLIDNMTRDFQLQDHVRIEHIINQRDVITITESELDESVMADCLAEAMSAALQQLIAMRLAEGEETRRDFDERLKCAESLLARIESRAPQVPIEWQQKLQERLAKLQKSVEWDPQRVAQEIAVFADRCDISEEIARFRSHLVQFRALFDTDEPVGRKMDFLVQELNREVNTMGSKSNDAELTMHVVALKSELEKVREQVQNIE